MSWSLPDIEQQDSPLVSSEDHRVVLNLLHQQLEVGYFSVPQVSAALARSPEGVLDALTQLHIRGLVEQHPTPPYLVITPAGHAFRSR